MRKQELLEAARAFIGTGRPFLGICVGYQMLFEESEESPGVKGFGFFPGKVKRFSTPGLKAVAQEVEATLEAIMAEAAG